MVYYNLGLVFVILVIISICYNIVLTNVVAETREHAATDKKKVRWLDNKPSSNCMRAPCIKVAQSWTRKLIGKLMDGSNEHFAFNSSIWVWLTWGFIHMFNHLHLLFIYFISIDFFYNNVAAFPAVRKKTWWLQY